jgi:ankyrin repeat protein
VEFVMLSCWSDYLRTHDLNVLSEELQTFPEVEAEPGWLNWVFGMALEAHDWAAAEVVLRNGYDLTPTDCGEGPLHDALDWLGDCPVVLKWLLDHGAERERRGINNWAPLHVAANRGLVGSVALLLDRGADINIGTVIDGNWTPLMEAAFRSQFDVVQLLVKRGADITRRDEGGETAEEIARRYGHREVADFLRDSTEKTSRRVGHDR